MKTLIFLLSCIVMTSRGYAQNKWDLLFDNTLKTLAEYASLSENTTIHKEINGIETKFIADSVFKIVYECPDSSINIYKKIDILHLMLYYQRYSSQYYSNLVISKMETDSSVRNNKLFLYPVLICERCDWQKASYLIEDSLQFHAYLEDKNLKNNYFLYYKRLHTYIEELYNIGDASTTYEVFKNVLLIWFVRTSPNYREYYKAYFIKN